MPWLVGRVCRHDSEDAAAHQKTKPPTYQKTTTDEIGTPTDQKTTTTPSAKRPPSASAQVKLQKSLGTR
eukprot:gene3390-2171_t